MAPKEQQVKLEGFGLSLAGRAWGAKNGHPTIALHGWLDNAASFDLLAPLLPELHLHALDFAGHGGSDHLGPGEAYLPVTLINHIFAYADALGWQEFHLIGHSLGACLASLMAGMYPERIKALVVLEGLGPLAREADKTPDLYRSFYENMQQLRQKKLPVYADQEKAAQARHKQSNVTIEAARMLAERGTKPHEGGWTWRTDPRLTYPTPHPFTEEQVIAFLQRITARTLFIEAEQRWPYDRSMMGKRCAAVGQLTHRILPGSHHLHMEYPEPIAEAIRAHFFTP